MDGIERQAETDMSYDIESETFTLSVYPHGKDNDTPKGADGSVDLVIPTESARVIAEYIMKVRLSERQRLAPASGEGSPEYAGGDGAGEDED